MTAMHAAGALVVLGLFAYLLFALFRPERPARTAWSLVQIALASAPSSWRAIPLGRYMARVYEGEPRVLGRVLGPLERLALPRWPASTPSEEMDWKTLRRWPCCVFNVARPPRRLRAAAAPGHAAAEPATGSPRVAPDWPSTPP